ncbi:unnamed protein product, partial [marine sediment metagenome]
LLAKLDGEKMLDGYYPKSEEYRPKPSLAGSARQTDKRFEIRYGRWGAYFYDTKFDEELDLNLILKELNLKVRVAREDLKWLINDILNWRKSVGRIPIEDEFGKLHEIKEKYLKEEHDVS